MNVKIPTLTPLSFKNHYIENNTDDLLNHENISQIFIHSFQEDHIKLKLPLPPHRKTINDFVFITKGNMIRNLGIDSYQLNQYDFLFTPKNVITTTQYVSRDLEGFYCHFSDELMGAHPFLKTLHTQSLNENFIKVPEKEVENLNYLLNRVLHLYKSSNEKDKIKRLISYYLSTILGEVFLLYKHTRVQSSLNNELLSTFKNLVYKQFKEQRSIKEYASQLHITPNHLNKIVKKETGKTSTEIIHEIIILEAKVLLFQTKLSISEISLAVGFEDVSYFSRLFKKKTGFSPSHFREKIDLS